MVTGTDTRIMAIPALGSLSVRLLFSCPLLRQFDTTITDLILLMITMRMSGMTEFGSQGIGNIVVAPTDGKEFGFLAIGNGDRIK